MITISETAIPYVYVDHTNSTYYYKISRSPKDIQTIVDKVAIGMFYVAWVATIYLFMIHV